MGAPVPGGDPGARRVAVSRVHRALRGVSRRSRPGVARGTGGADHDRGPARVRGTPLVGPAALQPDRQAAQGHSRRPRAHGHRGRPVPPRPLTAAGGDARPSAGGWPTAERTCRRWYRDHRAFRAGRAREPTAFVAGNRRRPRLGADPLADANHAPFRRAVLAVNGGPTDRQIVRLACDLAKPWKSEIVAVHVVEIDWTLPLDADVAGRSEEAQRVLDFAEAVAEESKYRVQVVLLQARDVGAALVDEASERNADLVVLGLPYRTRFGGDFEIGRTIPYVLKNTQCSVWVVRQAMLEGSP
ncbi:MAG: universal stress protein [Chloroflexi bacterium]|nr:universal stress protein [Chloroflexota bacterium]